MIGRKAQVAWSVVGLLVATGLTACKDDRTSPVKRQIVKSEAVGTAPVAPTNPLPDPEDDRITGEAKRNVAFAHLQPSLRRYARKKRSFELSERKYLEKIYLWVLAIVTLEGRGNVGVFAGDLPEREEFPYSEYMDAAENLSADLHIYLLQYEDSQDEHTKTLRSVQQEVEAALDLPFPGTGSRMQDAITAMKSREFEVMVNETNARMPELTTLSGKHIKYSAHQLLDKVTSLMGQFLH